MPRVETNPVAPNARTPEARPDLGRGSYGPFVFEAQTILKDLGLYAGELDSDFAGRTERAVRAFQKSKGLREDGIIGERTWPALLAAKAAPAPTAPPPAPTGPSQQAQTAAQQIAPAPTQAVTPATPQAPPSRPLLARGANGPQVEYLQKMLHAAGFDVRRDSDFGEQTEIALKRFQEENDLTPSGTTDPATWEKLRQSAVSANAALVLKSGSRGTEVETLQRQLSAVGFTVTVNGRFGSETKTQVESFQRAAGLPVTGIVNTRTLVALSKMQPQQQLAAGALAIGSHGAQVDQLQHSLAALGYPVGSDSTFGVETLRAVLRFQVEMGLPQTGVVDAAFQQKLTEETNNPQRRALMTYSPGTVFAPNAPETKELFRLAAQRAGLPATWADSSGLHRILDRESEGNVGIPNFTYRASLRRDVSGWTTIHTQLKEGKITATSSATGLGQLLSKNARIYYPTGLDGIGVPLQEAVGMLRYIADRYGTPDRAWARYQSGVGY
jgi:peptidoglycan hydrolase-like protein with peptidoglycan-binding domain